MPKRTDRIVQGTYIKLSSKCLLDALAAKNEMKPTAYASDLLEEAIKKQTEELMAKEESEA